MSYIFEDILEKFGSWSSIGEFKEWAKEQENLEFLPEFDEWGNEPLKVGFTQRTPVRLKILQPIGNIVTMLEDDFFNPAKYKVVREGAYIHQGLIVRNIEGKLIWQLTPKVLPENIKDFLEKI